MEIPTIKAHFEILDRLDEYVGTRQKLETDDYKVAYDALDKKSRAGHRVELHVYFYQGFSVPVSIIDRWGEKA